MASSHPTEIADVAIVGAGLAGLVAARRITEAGQTAVVLEARQRVGGRVLSADIGAGKVVEMGGHWVGPTQNRVAELATTLGVDTFPTHTSGDNLVILGDRRTRYFGEFPPLSRLVKADVMQAQARISRLSQRVNLEEPWDTQGADRLDSMTFATWLRRNVATPSGRHIIGKYIEGFLATPASEVSLLGALFAVRSATDFETMVAVRGGAQQDRFVGGSQLLAIHLAKLLDDRIVLDAPVRRVVQSKVGVRVESERFFIDARRAIVAVPPVLASRITYDPPLPNSRDGLMQRMPHGSVIKVNAIYDEAFWRREGLSGQAFNPQLPVAWTLDNSPPDGSPGALVAFFEAHSARRFSGAGTKERRRVVLECLRSYFGARAAAPQQFLEVDWSAEQWTRGCYFGQMTTGAWTQFGPALRAPCGRIHWAGAETAVRWNGYMDGAVESGERAAAEVLDYLDA